jgi:DUF1009 family protein
MAAADDRNKHEPEVAGAPLAIVCGGGTLPFTVADAAKQQGRRVVLMALRGAADAGRVALYPHHWVRVGQFGRCTRLAKAEGCRDLVLIGSVVRPTLAQLWPDWGMIRNIPRLLKLLAGGDHHVLSAITRAFENQGFRLLGAHEIAPEILMPKGPMGHHRPGAGEQSDIARGLALLKAMGPFDVGQAVVVANRRVLAVEAAEGTDQMLLRLAELREKGRIRSPRGVGVLVKAPKPGQDVRVDLPSIGPQTVEQTARAGLAGIAAAAGATIVAEAQQLAAMADRAKLFVVGVDDQADAE